MTILRALSALLLALAALSASFAARAQDFAAIPALQGRITDAAGMLRPEQRNALENVLQEYQTRTGSQVAVLLVASTAPEAIEQYGIRVAEAWQIGRKGVDDGVILIVAKDNPPALRRLRIEAGRGVQGTLTDAQSKRILQDVIAPHFRQNDYYGGLAAGISAITSLLDKERLPAPERRQQQAADEGVNIGSLLPMLFIFFVVASMIMSRGRSRRRLSSNGWGNTSGVILGSVLGNAIGSRGGFGGGGGGGFGGGGFSGGGGTFDGGGASGDW